MNKFLFFILLSLCCGRTILAQQPLEKGFNNPPPTAKPQTYWMWLNGNVSKHGITKDLEAMKRVGIQKPLIFNVDMSFPEGSVKYLSTQWLEMFKFTATEAKRLGMQIGFHNGPGLSSSGGPWVKPEDAMQKVVYSVTSIKAGKSLATVIPKPAFQFGYYEDIAVLAFPTPKGSQRIKNITKKSLAENTFTNNLEPDTGIVRGDDVIQKNEIVDLTNKLSSDGTLQWQPPAGEWTILRIGHTPNGNENRPAIAGGRGLECDKMSTEALDNYWKGGIQPIIDVVGSLVGTAITDCTIDSYEVGSNNWTKLFREEFKKRRGYDCYLYLPTLAGYYVGSGEISERFLWDFRQTISDLIADNYYGHFRKLCNQHGLSLLIEPYGGPFKSHRAGTKPDGVIAEFWLEKNLFLESPKLVASIAHLNGQAIVGSEAFTSFGTWSNYPATMKPVGDMAWAEGVNRFTFHVYAHQPWDVAPGLTFGVYGVEMNRMNTWWEQSKPYMNYLSRSQYLLQQGRNVADVLYFTGESRVNNASLHDDTKRRGYDYDQIGTEQIKELYVKDGKLYTKNAGPYQLLVLPESEWATPELLEKLKILTDGGATIVGTKPKKSPSLTNFPNCDEQVSALANELWPHKIHDFPSGGDIYSLLQQQKISPDFSTEISGNDLNFVHRKSGTDDIYFIANPVNQSRTEICRFRVSGKRPELWDAETGIITAVPIWNETNGVTEIPLSFSPYGSALIVFREVKNQPEHIVNIKESLTSQPPIALPHLQIIKAEYGAFVPNGVFDMTKKLQDRIDKKDFIIGAHIAQTDPAPGSMKEVRMDYEVHGERRQLSFLEGESRNLIEDSAGFRLIHAFYGKFRDDFDITKADYNNRDVTAQVRELIKSEKLLFTVSDTLFKMPKATSKQNNELRVTYVVDGENKEMVVNDGHLAVFQQELARSRIVQDGKKLTWLAPRPGKLTYATNTGKKRILTVNAVPKPITINGAWDVTFPLEKQQQKTLKFNELNSWTTSEDDDDHYFSGTAIYRKNISIPAAAIAGNNIIELDLGNVEVIAEVIVNGKNMGILWKAPFRIDLKNTLHMGINSLEIRVTNLWVNRLIGDERYPRDEFPMINGEKKWPEWLTNSEIQRQSKRKAFTTNIPYSREQDLKLSGLLGPVTLTFFHQTEISQL